MLTVSRTYRDAVVNSRTVEHVVDFYRDGVLIPGLTAAPVTGGRYYADRGQQVRLDCDVTLAVPEWEDIDLDVQSCRFKVRRGVSSLGFTETIQLGEFRVDSFIRPAIGAITVKGSGLEAYLLDARFLTPRTPPYGQSTVTTIINLITEVLPDATVLVRCRQDRPVLATAVWQRDRMDTIDDLANSIVAEVFCDSQGRFVIADQPNPTTGVPVYIADEGPAGVLIARSEESTRDRQYNAASVAGQSTDPDVPPVWAWSVDLNPASPTYFYGPFGQKPIFYTSQFFTTTAQCQAYADQLLVEALAENKTLTFTQLPADFLEVSDVVAVRTRAGVLEQHLLQSFSCTLGTAGGLAAKTLSSKIIIADGV